MSTAVDLYKRRDFAGLKALVAGASPDMGYRIVLDVAFNTPIGGDLDGMATGPSDVLGLTIGGGVLLHWGWRARGGLLAEATSNTRFGNYFALREAALQWLEAARNLDPRNGLATALWASTALEETEDGKRRAETALWMAPDAPIHGHIELMSAWTDKWGGSQDDMWAYLDRAADEKDPGRLALIPRAHWEQWCYFALAGSRRADGYFKRPDVRYALAQASEAHLAAPIDLARLNVGDGWFARVLLDAGKTAQAREHLKRLKGYRDPTTWTYGIAFISETVRFRWAHWRCGLF